MDGAMLATLVALVGDNAAKLGGLPGGGYSRVLKRQRGIPEGFVLCPLLFALVFSELADFSKLLR